MPIPQPDRGPHYFSSDPSVPSEPGELSLVLPEGHLLEMRSDRGVFSRERIDPGTMVLLTEGPSPASSPPGGYGDAPVLVDVGCGYGPVALALAVRVPQAVVWAVDVNARARELCRANATANGLGDRVRVVAPEEVPPDLVVDEIWSNPPVRIGKEELRRLLSGWMGRLRPGGRAVLVVQKHLGADSLARWMEAMGWPTTRHAARRGYRVLVASVPETRGGAR